jgi:four helix bundle protein
VVEYCGLLDLNKKYVISKQLLKAGTSVGANSFEAQNAESKADFIQKMKIAAKEAEETEYWLLLCKHSENYPNCDELLKELEVIQKIVSKIISSAKAKPLAN